MNIFLSANNFFHKNWFINFFKAIFCLSILNFSFCTAAAQVEDHRFQSDLELGVFLETRFWNLVEQHDVPGFSDEISHIFQGLNASGVYSRENQITGLAGVTIDSFAINDPIVTRHCDVLVIGYNFAATGEGIVSGPSISVWKKTERSWKWVSHSYFPAN